MEELKRIEKVGTPARVLVTRFDEAAGTAALALAATLRRAGLDVELYPEAKKLGEQLKYANRRLLEQVEEIEAKVQERQAHTTYRQRPGPSGSSSTGNAWANHLMSHSVPSSLKRSWDGSVVGNSSGRT